jgi:hypothetical protein
MLMPGTVILPAVSGDAQNDHPKAAGQLLTTQLDALKDGDYRRGPIRRKQRNGRH